MSIEANKAVMRRYFEEIWNGRELALLDELVAPDYVNHTAPDPSLPTGPAGLKPVFAAVLASFPDIQFSVDDVVAEGDLVVSRWTMRATPSGGAAAGRAVESSGISIDRVVDGKIVEHWRVSDDLGLERQLGNLPK